MINKTQFDVVTSGEETEHAVSRGGRSNESYVIRRLKTKEFRQYQGFTHEDEEYVRLVLSAYVDGIIPQNTTRRIKNEIEREVNPLKVLAILKMNIPYNLLEIKQPGQPVEMAKREVILSEYLAVGNRD